MPRAVILTALPVEYQAVCNHLKDLQDEVDSQGTRYQRGEFIGINRQVWDVGIAEMGAGNVEAAIRTREAIAYFNPDVIFLVGIAGGIKDVTIGDVVAAIEVYGYESSKELEGQSSTRPKTEKSTHLLMEIAKQETEKPDWRERLSPSHLSSLSSQPRVFVAPIASGEKVLASRKTNTFQLLRTNFNDAIAVEMEGLGFLRATFAYPNIQAIVIRGISDLVEGKNDPTIESEEVRQEIASHHASAFAFEILAKHKIQETTPKKEANIDKEEIIKVFISYEKEDWEIAKKLKEKLRQSGKIKTWDKEELKHGESIQATIKQEISSCNYLVIVLSENAIKSEEVSRAIGLIKKIHDAKEIERPIILGLADGKQESSDLYQIRDFETGEIKGTYDFSKERPITLELDLEEILLPQVHFIENLDDEKQYKLFHESIPVYHELFPIEEERDPEENIEERIIVDGKKDPKWKWKNNYAVLFLLNQVIGIGYFSNKLDKKWCFGNYIGIMPDYRLQVKGRWFFDEIIQKVKQDNPGLKGIIFEIEKPDFNFLNQIKEIDVLKDEDREEFIIHLRRLRRMNLFLSVSNVYMLAKRESSESFNSPFPYIQPGMKDPLEDNIVEDLIPLVYLFDIDLIKTDENLFYDIIDFLYQDIFGCESFPDLDEEEFKNHVAKIESEIKGHISTLGKENCFLAKDENVEMEMSQNKRIKSSRIGRLTMILTKLAKKWNIDSDIKL